MFHYMVNKKGDSIKALWWPNKERQHLIFEAFINNIKLKNMKILDLGCGFCDFYHFLKSKNINVEYYGVDISSKMINISKNKEENKEIYENIKCTDFLDSSYNIKDIDYIIIIGTFNANYHNNWELITKTIDKAFKMCNKGVAFNLISTYVDFQEDYLYYTDPAKIIDLCKKYTHFVNIINDYHKFEYLVVMHKK